MIGILMVDEVYWCNPHQRLESQKGKEKSLHTESIRADVITGETVELRKVTDMEGAKVEEVLPTLPH